MCVGLLHMTETCGNRMKSLVQLFLFLIAQGVTKATTKYIIRATV